MRGSRREWKQVVVRGVRTVDDVVEEWQASAWMEGFQATRVVFENRRSCESHWACFPATSGGGRG